MIRSVFTAFESLVSVSQCGCDAVLNPKCPGCALGLDTSKPLSEVQLFRKSFG